MRKETNNERRQKKCISFNLMTWDLIILWCHRHPAFPRNTSSYICESFSLIIYITCLILVVVALNDVLIILCLREIFVLWINQWVSSLRVAVPFPSPPPQVKRRRGFRFTLEGEGTATRRLVGTKLRDRICLLFVTLKRETSHIITTVENLFFLNFKLQFFSS